MPKKPTEKVANFYSPSVQIPFGDPLEIKFKERSLSLMHLFTRMESWF